MADVSLERLLGSEEEDKRLFYSELQGRTPWRDRAPAPVEDAVDPDSPRQQVHLHASQYQPLPAGAAIADPVCSPPPDRRVAAASAAAAAAPGPAVEAIPVLRRSADESSDSAPHVSPIVTGRPGPRRRAGSAGRGTADSLPSSGWPTHWASPHVSGASSAGSAAAGPQLHGAAPPRPAGPAGGGVEEAPLQPRDLVSPVEPEAKSPSSSMGASSEALGRIAQMRAEREAQARSIQQRKQEEAARRQQKGLDRRASGLESVASVASIASREDRPAGFSQTSSPEDPDASSPAPAAAASAASAAGAAAPAAAPPAAVPRRTPAARSPGGEDTMPTLSTDSGDAQQALTPSALPLSAVALSSAPLHSSVADDSFSQAAERSADLRYQQKAQAYRELSLQHAAAQRRAEQLQQLVDRLRHELGDAPARCAAAEQRSEQLELLVGRLREEVAEAHQRRIAAEEAAEQQRRDAQRLSAMMEGRNFRDAVGSGQLETIPKDQMDRLRQEIEAQDVELRGLNEDNRAKTEELRALRQQIKALREEQQGREALRSLQPGAGCGAAAAGPDASAREPQSQVVRDLTREANRLREQLRVQQQEWELEAQALRSAKAELQRKLERVDWQKAQDDDLKIRDLQAQLKKVQQDHAEERKELEEKVQWYVENQQLLSKNDELVHAQTSEIEALKSRVAELDTGLRKPKQLNQAKYIAELQKKIKGLEDIIKTKNPNSLPELIRACKPTESELSAYRAMQERVAQLNQELQDKQEDYEKSLRQLRHESDRLRLDHQRQMRNLEDEMKVKVRTATSAKIKELSRTIEETRTYYSGKIREHERQIMAIRKWARQKGLALPAGVAELKPASSGAAAEGSGGDKKAQASGTAQRAPSGAEVASTESQTDLSIRPGDPASTPWQGVSVGVTPGHAASMMMQGGMGAFGVPPYMTVMQQMDISNLTRECERLRSELDTARRAERDGGGELARLSQRAAAAEAERDRATADAAAYEQRACDFQRQLAELGQRHALELQQLRQSHQDALAEQKSRWDADVQRLEATLAQGREQVQLSHLRKGDQLQYLEAVRERLEAVERRHALRESELTRALDEAKRLARFEVEVQRQKMDLAIQAKNNDIARFKISLEALLGELEVLREQQQPRPVAARPGSA
eukprot:TRINITY_DN837_c0_g1_i1.p1 TRINITY_DN837_c0_g1~~TRINITY_DN837_c0_g1_i1.p1  ORF type:complete len:1175 (+),score=369.42 TRINITY_DN837_c0_g1_i1:72-3527(+)